MILDSATFSLEVYMAAPIATNQLPFYVSYTDINVPGQTFTPGKSYGQTNGVAAVTIVAAPSAGVQRQVKLLTIHNEDTISHQIFLRLNDNGTFRKITDVVLSSEDTLQWVDGSGWRTIDTNGSIKEVMVSGTTAGTVPIGGIVMWSGTIATIPANWALCDGLSNSPGPDLRDKFVVGARQDSAGVPMTNLEGTLQSVGGTTAHSHSAHANLSHAGLSIADHTGITVGIANHPDLTHVSIADHSVASNTVAVPGQTIADHSQASQSVAVPGQTIADHSQASQIVSGASGVGSVTSAVGTATTANVPIASGSVSNIGSLTSSLSSTGTARTLATYGGTPGFAAQTGVAASHTVNVPSQTQAIPSATGAFPANTLTHASQPSIVGSFPANTLTHASQPSIVGSSPAFTLTHAAPNTHVGSVYGVHSITQPGSAGTITHSYNEPNDHVISPHDTVGNVIPFYALAFIQRVA